MELKLKRRNVCSLFFYAYASSFADERMSVVGRIEVERIRTPRLGTPDLVDELPLLIRKSDDCRSPPAPFSTSRNVGRISVSFTL